MEFRFQDILKNIIPGSIFTITLAFFFLSHYTEEDLKKLISSDAKEYSEILLIVILTVFYLFGYILDSFASLLEFYIVHECIGRPSYNLLKGKGFRIKMVNHEAVIKKIKNKFAEEKNLDFNNKTPHDKVVAAKLFKLANTLKLIKQEKDSLLTEHYNSYVFARNLFWSTLFSCVLITIQFGSAISSLWYFMLFVILVVLYIRRRDRDYYYVREILLQSTQ